MSERPLHPPFTGVGPPIPNRTCDCGHGETERHVLDWRGRRAACGATVPGWSGPVRCPCNVFAPPRTRATR